MRNRIIAGALTLVAAAALGCQAKATDEQIEKMCKHLLEISGDMRGTLEKEEVARIETEYAEKEKSLKAEMERDLKGMDDVLAQKLSTIEKEAAEAAAPGEEEEKKKAKKAKEEEDEGEGEGENEDEEPLTKEEKIKAANEDIAKKKKEITDQFERLISKLGPQKKYAIRDIKKYVKKRQKNADKALKKCQGDPKNKELTEEKVNCRLQTDTRDKYFACK
jgi:hypothetical protein